MQYHFYLVIYSEFQVYFIACMSSIRFIWYHAIMLHDERALNFTSLIYFSFQHRFDTIVAWFYRLML